MMMRMTSIAAALAASLAVAAHAQPAPFTVTEVATLDNPWGMVFLPDGRALITEKPGRIRILSLAGTLSAPLAGVPAVNFDGQNGLLDIAISGSFNGNRLIYFTFSEPAGGGNSTLALAQGRFANDTLTAVKVIWRATPATTGGHPGGRIAFTGDGSIYVTTGERQQGTPAQNTAQTLGKIVRLNIAGKPRTDNPFIGNAAYKPEIWSLGHRNPYGLAYDPKTKILWESEMGPEGGDEINVVTRGANYGWPLVSEGNQYGGTPIPRHSTRPDFVAPKYAWMPSVAPSGLIVYSGSKFPAWKGNLLSGGLGDQSLIRLTTSGTNIVAQQRYPMFRRIRDVVQGPDGAIWLLGDGSGAKLLKLLPN
jgi:aldose sugar dehydrogenase